MPIFDGKIRLDHEIIEHTRISFHDFLTNFPEDRDVCFEFFMVIFNLEFFKAGVGHEIWVLSFINKTVFICFKINGFLSECLTWHVR